MISPRYILRSTQLLWKRYHSTYTTPSIEYVYGLSSVACALHAQKRKVNQIFVQHRLDSDSISHITDMCREKDIPIKTMDKGRLNNMTMNKPHQGVVLEASSRYTIPIKSLTWSSHLIDNTNDTIYTALPTSTKAAPFVFQKPRHRLPLWIALDQVQDPQNLGSIIRTAHFFGVDGLLVCSKNSAPLSAAVSKVSSGAMEIMDVYTTQYLVKFLEASREEGWEIIGAASESTAASEGNSNSQQRPRILVFGNEGTGLRTNVKRCCDVLINIPSGQQRLENGNMVKQEERYPGFVDSLNVGVAMGVLINTLLSSTSNHH
ncbi:RNA methyltransferase, TrmH family, group 3, partial [Halteromyces radiatus]|uniref:RNA methyltransferase, TrmH family, group 3 n=1 Tax=Halteromyces radiatus TaxID=101107 RepID=UPI00221E6023